MIVPLVHWPSSSHSYYFSVFCSLPAHPPSQACASGPCTSRPLWNALPSAICKAPPVRSGPQLSFQRCVSVHYSKITVSIFTCHSFLESALFSKHLPSNIKLYVFLYLAVYFLSSHQNVSFPFTLNVNPRALCLAYCCRLSVLKSGSVSN